jgi:phosphoglycolate phosphatase
MQRFLLFDLDGTLVDSNGVCVHILQGMLAERGSSRLIDPVASMQHMSKGGEHMVRALLAEDCGDAATDLAEFRARYAKHKTPRESLFEGVASGLERLHATGYTLAICSNKPIDLCKKVLQDTELAPFFSAVVGGRLGLRSKPAPDLLDAVLAQLAAPTRQCLFIGDSELDHAVAAAAKIPFCFMTYGYAQPGWSPHENAQSFDCFDDLVDFIVTRFV